MTEFNQQTIVRSLKLGIKNKFKSVSEGTENVITLLQTRVCSFREQVNVVLSNDDENFFPLRESLNSDIDKYQESLFLIQALLENIRQDEADKDNVVENLEEKQCDTPSNSKFEQVALQSYPSQTFCKTLYSRASLISSTSYCSLQDDCSVSQSHLYERQNFGKTSSKNSSGNESEDKVVYFRSGFYSENTYPKHLQYSNEIQSKSFVSSQSSCYQSLSSDINANKISKASKDLQHPDHLETFEKENHDNLDQCGAQTYNPTRLNSLILTPSISVPSVITATLSHKISPDDFWIQLEDSKEFFSFPTVEFDKQRPPLYIQPGYFCLALSNKVNVYYRAKILTNTSDDGIVEVFFIDIGSIHRVSVQNLRILPETAYQIPMRAIHCSLCDILPAGGSWSSEAIEKFKEYDGSCKVHVKSFNCEKYGVQLMIRILDYDVDISEVLCEDNLAIFKEVSMKSQLYPTYFPPVEGSNQISHDSGVSVTCNQRSSPCNQRLCISSEMLPNNSPGISPEPLQRKIYPPFEQLETNDINFIPYDTDLNSFESSDQVNCGIKRKPSSYGCSRTADCDCALHLVIQPPYLPIVDENKMVVMVSHVVSPSEFYVNAAMEDSCNLDDLREQMTAFYESVPQSYHVAIEDLKEGMFCAGRFDQDQVWYRAKVLRIHTNPHCKFSSRNRSDVFVQYIDYGNKASLQCSDLRLLKPQFSLHPSFAMKCFLAGIVPRGSEDYKFISWDKEAIETFKQLANFDRCLTAQIVKSSMMDLLPEGEAVEVLLWDKDETGDLLINEILVAKGVAEFDSNLVRNFQEQNARRENSIQDQNARCENGIQDQNARRENEEELLNKWDPMEAEFAGVENSYGVDADEIGVALSGYKQQDDRRICKYFSLRGHCPRGNNCSLEHVPLAEGGVTRDQVETYSLDPMPSLPAPSSDVFIQVSALISPGQFYCILPFGSKNVDEVDYLVRQGSDPDSWVKREVMLLYEELSRHYSCAPFDENTTISLSYGSIVVAWRSIDSAWHRGRIIDLSGIAGPAKVFFVDFGDSSWVERRKIREILPQFLHTPFQAVECHLSDVEPLGFEQRRSWSPHAINYFKELVSEAVLLAHITDRCGKILHLTMRKTGESEYDQISALLVKAGFAQYCSCSTTKRKESIYVPG